MVGSPVLQAKVGAAVWRADRDVAANAAAEHIVAVVVPFAITAESIAGEAKGG